MARGQVTRHPTAGGRVIYRLPLEVFPGFWGNAYVVAGGSRPLLVDCGSGREASNRDLEQGFESLASEFGEGFGLADLGHVVITHGHIDHFGGLHFLRRRTSAAVAVHVLDRRVLSHYEERLVVASHQVGRFLAGTGIRGERQAQYMQMYLSMKQLFESLPVDLVFEEGELLGGELVAYHVPGHCPGQVCLRVDDVLLTADHVLAGISPHLSPEVITLNTGVGHYLASLAKVEALSDVRLGLGGHKGPIAEVARRAAEIRRLHAERHEQLLELAAEPQPIAALSHALFGRVRSYHALLALLETGAQVEYLYQRGELRVVNVEELETATDPVVLYQRVS